MKPGACSNKPATLVVLAGTSFCDHMRRRLGGQHNHAADPACRRALVERAIAIGQYTSSRRRSCDRHSAFSCQVAGPAAHHLVDLAGR